MKRRICVELCAVILAIASCFVLTAVAAEPTEATTAKPSDGPNLLIIMTDQQFADGMSCVMGTKWLRTPNMDRLAENGTRFTRAYSPNPLCVPMRTSMMTGCYPHQTGVQTNGGRLEAEEHHWLGKIFRDAGYETAYFGKWHVSIMRAKKEIHGFETLKEKEGKFDAGPIAAFLKRPHDRPFLAVASFLSPHEICEWARKERIPRGPIGEPPPLDQRPPMKQNFDPPKNETDIMAHVRKSYHAARMFPVGDYTEADWRRHSWGYFRLIERADRFVGEVLDALRASGREENTVVLFLSDHGDCHGAHRWNQKTVFYDESSRVPLMISWKGKTPKGTSDTLVNVGLDVIPTLCDFAGIDLPADLPGKSMKAPAMGKKPVAPREYVVSQNHMRQGTTVDGQKIQPQGRMVRSARYKYCLYSEGQRRESLVDMEKDPGEMVNLAGDPKFGNILLQHRSFLKRHAERHSDQVAIEMLEKVAK